MSDFTGSNVGLYIQPDGCGEELYYLDCSVPQDFTVQPNGTFTTNYCINEKGEFVERNKTAAPPEDIEFTINSSLTDTANWLDTVIGEGVCNFPMYVTFHCPRPGMFANWNLVYQITGATFESYTIAGFGDIGGDDPINKNYVLKVPATNFTEFRQFNLFNVPNSVYAYDLLAIDFCSYDSTCGANCNDDELGCSTAVIAGANNTSDGTYALTLDSLCSAAEFVDDGSTAIFGANTTTQVMANICTQSVGTNRQIYVQDYNDATVGTLDIAYADDEENYVTVAVSAGNDSATGPNVIKEDKLGNIFLVSDLGYIFKSDDGGVSWTTQDAGAASGAAALHAINFRNDQFGLAGGAGGVLVSSSNGGESWSAVTQTDITTKVVSIEYSDSAWVIATEDGKLYTSRFNDGLAVFNEVQIPGTTGNTTKDMKADGCFVAVAYDKSSGTNPGRYVYSVNGGTSWEGGATGLILTNTGFNALQLNNGSVWIAGNGGTIIKASTGKR